jgi:hypothetical protein
MRDLNGQEKEKSEEKGQFIVHGFFSIFFVVGIGILIYGGYLFIKAAQSCSWPSTDGVIKTSRELCGGRRGNSYSAEITYEYFVNENRFTGNKKQIIEVGGIRSGAEAYLEKYPVGKNVKVYYSPADSTNSVLEPGLHLSCLFLPFIGCTLIAIPSIIYLLPLFIGRRSREQRAYMQESATRS